MPGIRRFDMRLGWIEPAADEPPASSASVPSAPEATVALDAGPMPASVTPPPVPAAPKKPPLVITKK